MEGGAAIYVLLFGFFLFHAEATNITCDFEDGTFCSWTPEDTAMKWKINAKYRSTNSMPKFDHTKGNYNGRYAYAIGNGLSVKKSSLKSVPLPDNWGNGMCFSFWYFMNTDSLSSLTVAADRVKNKKGYLHNFWKKQGNFGNRWRHSYVNIETNAIDPQLTFTASLLTGTIAIDDIEADRGICPPEMECTFDGHDMCDYGHDVKNTIDWVLKNAADEGVWYPILDHTTQSNSGHFLYVAFNGSDEIPFQKASISTPEQPVTSGSCITFYYHIYNTSNLYLNTYVSTDKGMSDPQWSVSQSQGLLWHGARFNILSPTLKWQVIFEAAVKNKGYGQVALDDIEITSGACPPPGFCDFEDDNCLWENVRNPYQQKTEEFGDVQHVDMVLGDFDWVRHIAEDFYGPSVDHTLGSSEGFYLLLDARYQNPGKRAVYMSERLRSSGTSSCFTFWYVLPNLKNAAELRVFSSSDFQKALRLYKDDTNEEWRRSRVTVDHKIKKNLSYTDYWIYLAGYPGNNSLGYAAVDDFYVTEGDCQAGTVTPPTEIPTVCPPNSFKCIEGNVNCIPTAWRCDCHNDCEDKSDEVGCEIRCLSTTDPTTTTSTSLELTTTTETYPETTVIPKGRCNETHKLCGDGKTCIPGILLCDGVPDCPDGSDEAYCPGERRCDEGFYFCQDKMFPPCLHRERICDGNYDCSDGSDESLCGVCPEYYCRNEGICSQKAKVSICKCPPGFAGHRCLPVKKEENKIDKIGNMLWSFNFNGSFQISWSKTFSKDYK